MVLCLCVHPTYADACTATGQSTPDITRWLAGHSDTSSNSSGCSGESASEHAPQHLPHAQGSV